MPSVILPILPSVVLPSVVLPSVVAPKKLAAKQSIIFLSKHEGNIHPYIPSLSYTQWAKLQPEGKTFLFNFFGYNVDFLK